MCYNIRVDPSQIPSALASSQPPAGAPQPSPLTAPGAPPPSPQGGQQGGGSGKLLQILLTFLAGAGLKEVIGSLDKLVPKPPKGGARADAAKSPQQSIPPQIMQQAQQQAQGGAENQKIQMLLSQLGGGMSGM